MEMPSTFTCISPLPFFSMSLLLLLLLPPLAVSLLLCCLGVAVVIRRGRAVTEVSVKEQAFQCPHCTLFQPNFSSSPYLSSPFNFPHRKRQFIIHRMSTVLIELTVDIKKKIKSTGVTSYRLHCFHQSLRQIIDQLGWSFSPIVACYFINWIPRSESS